MPKSLTIVADENIPFAKEAFGTLGTVKTFPAGEITAAAVRDADLLCVRSVTKVNEDLLEKSKVRFVGTATIGTDHLDLKYLQTRGISFAAAPGSNATSVSEWFTAAVLEIAAEKKIPLAGMTLGIIGVGNVGSRVAQKGTTLGMRVLRNDPPRQRVAADQNNVSESFVEREQLLAESDIVTVHVPLNRDGEDCTVKLADAGFFAAMKDGATFMNSSRGAVVVEAALLDAIAKKNLTAILDVWENEPTITSETFHAARFGTPHIAGYAFDGKVRGTEMIYVAACEALEITPTWKITPQLLPPQPAEIELDCRGKSLSEILRLAVRPAYPISEDHARLAAVLAGTADTRGAAFTRLRKEYPCRREFSQIPIRLKNASTDCSEVIRQLGFKLRS